MATAGLLSLGGIGAAAGGVASAAAADPLVNAVQQTDDTTATTTATDDTSADDTASASDPTRSFRDALQALVDDGTITAEQQDAIVTALTESGPFWGDRDWPAMPGDRPRPGGPGMPGSQRGGRGPGDGRHEHLAVVAETIGIEEADLLAALRDGQTIAQVAEANNVGAQAVIDALIAQAEQRITDLVNGVDSTRDEASATSDTPASESTSSSSTAETTQTTTG